MSAPVASPAAAGAAAPVRRHGATLVAGLSTLLLATAALYARNVGFHFDEFYFLDAAKQLAVHGKYATFANGQFRLFDPYLSTGPTVIAPVALALRLFGSDYFIARLVMVILLPVLFFLMYRLTAELHDRTAGLVAVIFLLCVPDLWFYALTVLGEIPATVFFLAAAHVLARAERVGPAPWRYALAGVLLGLAALTKVVFLPAVGVLGAVALWARVRWAGRGAGYAVATGASLLVLLAWELAQLAGLGMAPYLEMRREFWDILGAESGVRPWLTTGARGLAATWAELVADNFTALRVEGGLHALPLVTMVTVGLVEIARAVARGGPHARLHLVVGAFLASYLAWFFLARHSPWFRLLIPAYLVLGIYVAPFLVRAVRALLHRPRRRPDLVLAAVAGYLVVALGAIPAVVNARELLRTCQARPARADLGFVEAVRRQVPSDARIGYWGWQRAPEVSFFLPNRFYDVSQAHHRDILVPGRDFLLVSRARRATTPEIWAAELELCGQRLLSRPGTLLCRLGPEPGAPPTAVAARPRTSPASDWE